MLRTVDLDEGSSPGLNFINVPHTNFSTNVCFSSFYYVRITRKMTFVRKTRAFYVDEIDTRCQFHQHFTSTFCANIFAPKKFKAKTYLKKLRKVLLYKKFAHKMLMKLTPAVNFINILRARFCTKANCAAFL